MTSDTMLKIDEAARKLSDEHSKIRRQIEKAILAIVDARATNNANDLSKIAAELRTAFFLASEQQYRMRDLLEKTRSAYIVEIDENCIRINRGAK